MKLRLSKCKIEIFDKWLLAILLRFESFGIGLLCSLIFSGERGGGGGGGLLKTNSETP